jgi:hypothetical protein
MDDSEAHRANHGAAADRPFLADQEPSAATAELGCGGCPPTLRSIASSAGLLPMPRFVLAIEGLRGLGFVEAFCKNYFSSKSRERP